MEKRINLLEEGPVLTLQVIFKKQKKKTEAKLALFPEEELLKVDGWRACGTNLQTLLLSGRAAPRLEEAAVVATATFRGTDKRTRGPVWQCVRLPGQWSQRGSGAAFLTRSCFEDPSSTFQAFVCVEVFSLARNYALTFDPKIIIIMILLHYILLWLIGLQPNRKKLFHLSQTEDLSFDLFFCAT